MQIENRLIVSPENSLNVQFLEIARSLLTAVHLVAGGRCHQLLEIEFYLHTDYHPDPFVHRNPYQASFGNWYFHRKNRNYCGGSFKGVDITFAPSQGYGGILIRSIRDAKGLTINGSSLVVDYLLKSTGYADIKSLDSAIGHRKIWDNTAPIYLTPCTAGLSDIFHTSRVGLTLKKHTGTSRLPEYIARTYRFLIEPKLKKGKEHTIFTLYNRHFPKERIAAITDSRLASVESYIQSYIEGQSMNYRDFVGKSLSVFETCQMIGCLSGTSD